MKSWNDVRGPRITPLPLASGLTDYLMRVQELGAVEGSDGGVALHPDLKPILEAMHHVLAGGEVQLNVVHRGNPDIVNELNRRVQQATDEANAINKAVGFYLTASV